MTEFTQSFCFTQNFPTFLTAFESIDECPAKPSPPKSPFSSFYTRSRFPPLPNSSLGPGAYNIHTTSHIEGGFWPISTRFPTHRRYKSELEPKQIISILKRNRNLHKHRPSQRRLALTLATEQSHVRATASKLKKREIYLQNKRMRSERLAHKFELLLLRKKFKQTQLVGRSWSVFLTVYAFLFNSTLKIQQKKLLKARTAKTRGIFTTIVTFLEKIKRKQYKIRLARARTSMIYLIPRIKRLHIQRKHNRQKLVVETLERCVDNAKIVLLMDRFKQTVNYIQLINAQRILRGAIAIKRCRKEALWRLWYRLEAQKRKFPKELRTSANEVLLSKYYKAQVLHFSREKSSYVQECAKIHTEWQCVVKEAAIIEEITGKKQEVPVLKYPPKPYLILYSDHRQLSQLIATSHVQVKRPLIKSPSK